MSAVETVSTQVVFFINEKALSGATGSLFVRTKQHPAKELVPVDRLVYRLVAPKTQYPMLHELFTEKALFHFEVHYQLHVLVSVTAVISEIVKEPNGEAVCLVEFDLP